MSLPTRRWEEAYKSLEAERDRLKAELKIESEKYSILGADFCDIEKDRDAWKEKAEKLAEALRHIVDDYYDPTSFPIAKAALDEINDISADASGEGK